MRSFSAWYVFLFIIGSASSTCRASSDCLGGLTLNAAFRHAKTIQEILDHQVKLGVPGISVAIYSEEQGWWATTAGYSRVETKTPMTLCNLQYLQSIFKTYMAVTILKLFEEGKVGLDHPNTDFLPDGLKSFWPDQNKITIRMLLQHRSGLPEYNSNPKYVSSVMKSTQRRMTPEEMLRFTKGEKLQFVPGKQYLYTNTNYLLLALVAEQVTKNHGRYLRVNLLEPLGLTHSRYHDSKTYLDDPMIVDSYWDVLNSRRPANVTGMQKANVASMAGDDGMVATPVDAVLFLKGLIEGRLLKPPSFKEMTTWTKDEKGIPLYGMGLANYSRYGVEAFGHGGGGIGAGAFLAYSPTKKTYLFIGTNLGTLIEGPLSKLLEEMKNGIAGLVL